MSQSFDLSQFPDLPPEVVKAFVAQSAALEAARFEASVERAARQHEQAVVAEKEAFITELKLDPHSGITVIFRSKRGDRLKILVWDGTGMVLTYKVLEQGNFAWPKVQDGTMRLSRAQFEALFEGLDWRRMMALRVPPPAAAG